MERKTCDRPTWMAYPFPLPLPANLAAGRARGVFDHRNGAARANLHDSLEIAWHPELFDLLVAQVTSEAVAAQFHHRAPSRVQRFVLPKLHAMNFVLDGVLDGGVNDALNLDTHGKALSFLLLALPVDVPDHLHHLLAGPSED